MTPGIPRAAHLARHVATVAGVAALAGLAAVSTGGAADARTFTVARVIDGDTLALTSGTRVRLVQIDAPEVGTGECYSRKARSALARLAPPGARIVLEADPRLDTVDRYGRLLRYVKRSGINVNIRLVLDGAAAPWFSGGDRGRYADRLLAAVARARTAKKGLWRACPATALDVYRAIETRQKAPVASAPKRGIVGGGAQNGNCDPNYGDGCVPRVPYDLDCADIRGLGIAPVRVVGFDVHRLDGDGDGWGCE
jgi:micrococcal nuclease